MHRNSFHHLLIAFATAAVTVVIGLWSWNTLAALLELPAAELRHALAVLGMLAVLRGLFLPGRGHRRRRLPWPGRRGSST